MAIKHAALDIDGRFIGLAEFKLKINDTTYRMRLSCFYVHSAYTYFHTVKNSFSSYLHLVVKRDSLMPTFVKESRFFHRSPPRCGLVIKKNSKNTFPVGVRFNSFNLISLITIYP